MQKENKLKAKFLIYGLIIGISFTGMFYEAQNYIQVKAENVELKSHIERIENKVPAGEVKASPDDKPEAAEGEDKTSSLPPAREVIATTYNAEVGQTDSDPLTMASGKKVYEGAVASNCHKIGTKIDIDGKTYVVEDRMNKRFTSLCGTENERVDIFKWDRKDNFKKKISYRVLS